MLMTLEVSFTLLDYIYSTGVTHDDRHIFREQASAVGANFLLPFCK